MLNESKHYTKFNFDEHARTCAPDDLLGQARRTINGVPVSDEQIQMIVDKIRTALNIEPDDILLDIACGNGALTQPLFDSCSGYLGVDISGYLISIAKKKFEKLPNYRFSEHGASEYVRQESMPSKYSKVLCYGSFQYFSAAEAAEVLGTLFEKFKNVKTVFIGNLPDKDKVAEFYKFYQPTAEELLDCQSQIGTWRTRSEFSAMAINAGWKVEFSTMPTGFYASHYRVDALLSR